MILWAGVEVVLPDRSVLLLLAAPPDARPSQPGTVHQAQACAYDVARQLEAHGAAVRFVVEAAPPPASRALVRLPVSTRPN